MKKSELRIGLDIDGVLAEFEQCFLEYLGLPLHGAKAWDDSRFTENFGRIANDENFWYSISPILKGENVTCNPVGYVTARPIRTEITRKWLAAHNFPKRPVITVGHDKSKLEAMYELGINLFLDDAHHNYTELNEGGVRCLLVTRNHNKTIDVGEDRVGSLLDFQNKLEDGSIFDIINADYNSVSLAR